jgi:hypothetical protein
MAAKMIEMLNDLKAEDETNVWWLDWGSLLSFERGQPPMPWDSDVDFAMLIPAAEEGGVGALVQRIKRYHDNLPKERQFTRVNYPTINPFKNKTGYSTLIQFKHSVCASDIFLYDKDVLNESAVMTAKYGANTVKATDDARYGANYIISDVNWQPGNAVIHNYFERHLLLLESDVFPLQCNEDFVGVKNVCVPKNVSAVMTAGYGPNHIVPDVNWRFCLFHIKDGFAPAAIYFPLLVGMVMLLAGLWLRLQRRNFRVACVLLSSIIIIIKMFT